MSCERSFTVRDTLVETFHIVMQSHANPLGVLHGGNMIKWLVDTATLSASRVIRGYALLAGIDFILLEKPVRVGETLVFYSWAGHAGRSSVEIGVACYSLGGPGGATLDRVSTAHMTFVNVARVQGGVRPKAHGACISPSVDEEELAETSLRLREVRAERLKGRRKAFSDTSDPSPVVEGAYVESYRIVNPPDSIAYDVMHAGSMLYIVDEIGAVIASGYSKGVVVTGFIGPADFYTPIYVGSVLRLVGALSYVGKTSMEVEVKAFSREMWGERPALASRAFLTYINLGFEGRPTPIKSESLPRAGEEAVIRARLRREVISMLSSGEIVLEPPKEYIERLRSL